MANEEMANKADWTQWLPGLAMLRQYRANWLANDIVAGLVLTTMPVPVGISYAAASGAPGIYGLYTTIVPLIAYAPFGPHHGQQAYFAQSRAEGLYIPV